MKNEKGLFFNVGGFWLLFIVIISGTSGIYKSLKQSEISISSEKIIDKKAFPQSIFDNIKTASLTSAENGSNTYKDNLYTSSSERFPRKG